MLAPPHVRLGTDMLAVSQPPSVLMGGRSVLRAPGGHFSALGSAVQKASSSPRHQLWESDRLKAGDLSHPNQLDDLVSLICKMRAGHGS